MQSTGSVSAVAEVAAALLCLAAGGIAFAAPDEARLGKAEGYPVGDLKSWSSQERVRVGSFSAQGEIAGLYGGHVKRMAAAAKPMPLPHAPVEPDYRWSVGSEQNLSVDDYLSRQRVMGLLIIKDGVIQIERYQYDRGPQHRFLSQSMAKSITALAVGAALREGRIRSLDDRASLYAGNLKGTLLGETSIRNLLRMASGAKFVEDYSGKDDAARFASALLKNGIESAVATVGERGAPEGTRFSYATAQTHALSAVLHGATGMSVCEYLTPRLWQAIGAETPALWWSDRNGLTIAGSAFNATLRDYGRLGIVLANDGVRPDVGSHAGIVARDFLLDATDWRRAEPPFRPGYDGRYFGYGYQFWLFPGERRRFAMVGVYGQYLFVDPAQKLVMVHVAANATAKASDTSLAREADALWRGVVRHYGRW